MKIKSLMVSLMTVLVLTMGFTPDQKTTYKVDHKKSKLTWVGRKVTGEHTGNINLADGKFVSDGKTITGGTFDIDMTSISNTDLTDKESNQKLVGHLKSDDFFSSDKHPKSSFVITTITPKGKDQYNVKGKLTIKGITNEVEFPATILMKENEIKGTAKIKVDRTKYGIKYGSGSFFDNLGDKAIDNEFELNVELLAVKENDLKK